MTIVMKYSLDDLELKKSLLTTSGNPKHVTTLKEFLGSNSYLNGTFHGVFFNFI